jgi:hypothetical protein
MAEFDQTFINTLIALFGATMGWVLKVIWDAVKDLQEADDDIIEKVNKLEVFVAQAYPTRDELRQEFSRIFNMLNTIDHKLDQKADK